MRGIRNEMRRVRRYDMPPTVCNLWLLVPLGLMVHTLVMLCVLEMYFSSPIDQGMAPITATKFPPAKRVAFIVADGLRADHIFGHNYTKNAPFLNKVRKTRGSWGLSNTRVPTESRPGHVALLAGVYEDPAAIFKGWSSNPVDFDSVIDHSAGAYCWGGPTIINLFNKDKAEHVMQHSYSHLWEDFGNNNTIGLDAWVFRQLNAHMDVKITCWNCGPEQRKTQVIYFFHLLGIDTAGHSVKPHSKALQENIRYVDTSIRDLERKFEISYQDQDTAFIFTSDHGMTDWGSHGSGSFEETTTPFIAWGAGINIDPKQKDIDQVDVAPLISALIGINYPTNSLGRLPIDYIDAPVSSLGEMIVTNVHQLLETFNIKKQRRMDRSYWFNPFRGVSDENIVDKVAHLEHLWAEQDITHLKNEAVIFMNFLIKGIEYYHNYYQLPLLISISSGLVFWVIYLLTFTIDLRESEIIDIRPPGLNLHMFFTVLYVNIYWVVIIKQDLPLLYYCCYIFPVISLHLVSYRNKYLMEAFRLAKRNGFRNSFGLIALYLIALRLLVESFKIRYALIGVFLILAFSVVWSSSLNQVTTTVQKIQWIVCNIVVSLFTLAPLMRTEFVPFLHILGYGLWFGSFSSNLLLHLIEETVTRPLKWQVLIYKLTIFYTMAVEYDYVPSQSYLKNFAWLWAALPITLIVYTPNYIVTRMCSIAVAFGTFYLMVTANYESLFMMIFFTCLLCWLMIESRGADYIWFLRKTFDSDEILAPGRMRGTNLDDFRRAFQFIAFIFIGFFGTGNIASLSSFDPMWVRCFISVFSPYTMTAFILLRIAVPFIFAVCAYRGVNLFVNAYASNMFCIVLMFSDIMLLQLLFQVTNIGSWIEIGTSLSQFIIMESFVMILLFLYSLCYYITAPTFSDI